MNKQFSIGKVVVHGANGTSVYRDIDEALSHLSGSTTNMKGSEKPRGMFAADYADAAARTIAASIESTPSKKVLGNPYGDSWYYGPDEAMEDPLKPLTHLSEDLGLYDDKNRVKSEFSSQDPEPTGHASISVEMSGDKWFINDLLRVLEATILGTLREYKEFNHGARSIQTRVSTSTQSTQ